MITIHEKTAQTFDTFGLGALVPSHCVVEEELNGAYELELKHPYDDGGKWKRIERGRILYASTPRGMQPFRIYYVKPSMKEIAVNARHIFYDLLDNQCEPISHSGTATAALAAMQAAFAYPMPFSFDTDISLTGTLTTGRMNPVQVLLSDDDEATSFVKGYGGELLRDGFRVSVKAALGQDRGVSIRYGKNLVGLEVTEDESEVKTRIICYGKNGSVTLESPHLGDYIYPKIHTLTEENKSISEVQAEARKLLDEGCTGKGGGISGVCRSGRSVPGGYGNGYQYQNGISETGEGYFLRMGLPSGAVQRCGIGGLHSHACGIRYQWREKRFVGILCGSRDSGGHGGIAGALE